MRILAGTITSPVLAAQIQLFETFRRQSGINGKPAVSGWAARRRELALAVPQTVYRIIRLTSFFHSM